MIYYLIYFLLLTDTRVVNLPRNSSGTKSEINSDDSCRALLGGYFRAEIQVKDVNALMGVGYNLNISSHYDTVNSLTFFCENSDNLSFRGNIDECTSDKMPYRFKAIIELSFLGWSNIHKFRHTEELEVYFECDSLDDVTCYSKYHNANPPPEDVAKVVKDDAHNFQVYVSIKKIFALDVNEWNCGQEERTQEKLKQEKRDQEKHDQETNRNRNQGNNEASPDEGSSGDDEETKNYQRQLNYELYLEREREKGRLATYNMLSSIITKTAKSAYWLLFTGVPILIGPKPDHSIELSMWPNADGVFSKNIYDYNSSLAYKIKTKRREHFYPFLSISPIKINIYNTPIYADSSAPLIKSEMINAFFYSGSICLGIQNKYFSFAFGAELGYGILRNSPNNSGSYLMDKVFIEVLVRLSHFVVGFNAGISNHWLKNFEYDDLGKTQSVSYNVFMFNVNFGYVF